MRIPLLSSYCGSPVGSKGLISYRKSGNNVLFSGSIVLLLVWSFVGDCGGIPFHPGGQAEMEEDTTQGSLKEKFPQSIPQISSSTRVHSSLIDDSGLDDGDVEDNEYDTGAVMVGNVGLVPLSGGRNSPDESRDYPTYRHSKQPPLSNYLIGGNNRAMVGNALFPDDVKGDDEFQRFQRSNNPNSNRRGYYEPSGGIQVQSRQAAPAVDSNRIRQKLMMNLRNQYGDKWMSFVGPYAYRKRQILYRQCFFNPISCF